MERRFYCADLDVTVVVEDKRTTLRRGKDVLEVTQGGTTAVASTLHCGGFVEHYGGEQLVKVELSIAAEGRFVTRSLEVFRTPEKNVLHGFSQGV